VGGVGIGSPVGEGPGKLSPVSGPTKGKKDVRTGIVKKEEMGNQQSGSVGERVEGKGTF